MSDVRLGPYSDIEVEPVSFARQMLVNLGVEDAPPLVKSYAVRQFLESPDGRIMPEEVVEALAELVQ